MNSMNIRRKVMPSESHSTSLTEASVMMIEINAD
jgi:hypothetical protein